MGRPAARIGDTTMHGSPLLGKGCPTVLIGNMPAWRVGDQHTCPIPNAPPPAGPGTPHGPGITTGIPDGPGLCLIGGQPAARVQDIVTEPGAVVPLPPPNPIQMGCVTVLIGTLAPMPGAPLTPDVCQTEGHPVDVATGRMIEWVTDFERLSPAPLIFKRFYDSRLAHSGVFGPGWRHCYEFSIRELESELEVIDEVGRTLSLPKPELGETRTLGAMRVESTANREYVVWLKPDKGLRFAANEWGQLVLVTVHDPAGMARHLSYDTESRLTLVRDHCGHALEFQYSGDRIVSVLERSCQDNQRSRLIAEYAYHPDGSLAAVYDAVGKALSYLYDEKCLVQETDRTGFSFYFEYDRDGRCIRTWGDGGLLYRQFDYDMAGGLTRVIDSHGVSRFYEHAHGRVTRLIHSDGTAKVWTYNEHWQLIAEQDESGVGFYYEYDPLGRVAKAIMAGGGWVQYAYDDAGRMTSCLTSERYAETWLYDNAGRILVVKQGDDGPTECRYDTFGNLASVTRAGHVTEFSYDRHNRMVQIASNEGHRIHITYDAFSNVSRLRDSLGVMTSRAYDELDRLASITDPDGRGTEYRWNANGLLEFVRERDGVERRYSHNWQLGTEMRVRADGMESVTRYEYDAELHLTAIRMPGFGQIGYVWNDRGHLIERHETSGEVVRFRHDSAGRVIEETNSAFTVRFKHDLAGNLVAVQGPDGSSVEYGYDGFGRIILGAAGEHVCKLEYDRAGRLVRESSGRRSIEYSYGPTGQRIRLKPSNGVPVGFHVAPSGAIISITAADKLMAEYRRDGRGRLLDIQFGNGLLEHRVLGGMGQVQSQELLAAGGASVRHREYQYDTDLRLVERRSHGGPDRFTYTGLGWIESERLANEAEARSLHYDEHGNSLEFSSGKAARYGEGDRLLSDGKYTYEYDAIGRLSARTTENAERTVFHYDFRDLLVQVDHPDGSSTSYRYDAFGRRVLKVAGARHTAYQWDGHQLVAAWDPALPSVVTQFVMDPFRWTPLAQLEVRAGKGPPQMNALYCHADYIGAVTDITSASGELLWSAEYDAFGTAKTVEGNANLTILRRPGQYFDAETGFYYNRYRYYDPSNGRFTTPDPAHVSGGLNLYRYPGSTLTTVDLLGLSPASELIAVVDNNFLASLENAVATGQDSWLVRYATTNKGRLGVSSTAYNEFTQAQGFGASHLKRRRELLDRFKIEPHVPCNGTATADFAEALARYQATGLGAPGQAADARIAAHARASNLPLISADQRAFVTNQQFFTNNVASVEQLGVAEGAKVFMLRLI